MKKETIAALAALLGAGEGTVKRRDLSPAPYFPNRKERRARAKAAKKARKAQRSRA